MKFVNNNLYKKMRYFFLPFFCLIPCAILLFLFALGTYFQDKPEPLPLLSGGSEQEEIIKAEEIIRFHVRAHSNSPADQEIKNYLARKTISLYGSRWSNCSSKEELRIILSEDKEDIEIMARETLEKSGFAHDVKISLEKGLFPARLYNGKLYPPGEYEALNMIIGNGDGENWWCVLFPPLCFNVVPLPTDEGRSSLPVEERDGESPGREVYQKNIKKPEWRFWLVEILFKIAKRFTEA
jgi:stage II sporulation protein R